MNFDATNELLLSILWKIIGQANYPIQNVHQIARFVLYITYMANKVMRIWSITFCDPFYGDLSKSFARFDKHPIMFIILDNVWFYEDFWMKGSQKVSLSTLMTLMAKLQDSSFSYVCNAALKKNKGQPHISMRLFHHHRFKLGPIYKQKYAQGAKVIVYKSRGEPFFMKNNLIFGLFFLASLQHWKFLQLLLLRFFFFMFTKANFCALQCLH